MKKHLFTRKTKSAKKPNLFTRGREGAVEALESRIAPAVLFSQLVDPHPSAGNQFGQQVLTLSTGNVLVTSPGDDFAAQDGGAVYLFDGTTGSLISELHGSHQNDYIGNYGIIALNNGNFLVNSGQWDNGTILDAGAVTWGSGTTGVSGTVSAANSLVGTHQYDYIGNYGVTVLSNGNYVVSSANWNNQTGAVTLGMGATGTVGEVSASNSFVGGTAAHSNTYTYSYGNYTSTQQLGGDRVGGYGIHEVGDGNFVILSPEWGVRKGAVTWVKGDGSGVSSGVVDASNSLIGSTAATVTFRNDGYYSNLEQVSGGDFVGQNATKLSNGNYVVGSPNWTNGGTTNAGAATWANGATGLTGVVSAANSLVGTHTNDYVSNYGITALSNGNYVVKSAQWSNGGFQSAGAVTWGNGTTGVSGAVSEINSLVGTHSNDYVGNSGVTALSNGNYVVNSPSWSNVGASSAGAVTWGDGTTGVSGAVSETNSLVGTHTSDSVGNYGIRTLSSGNFLVLSSSWDNGLVTDAGAVTWGSGTTGVSGVVSAANSLVGTHVSDYVGSGVTLLSNGNYVVNSPNWNNQTGAVTLGMGTSGVSGDVSASNSFVGATAAHSNTYTYQYGQYTYTQRVGGDRVGSNGAVEVGDGNFVILSSSWGVNKGAATWVQGDGTGVSSGIVSASNSLTGSTAATVTFRNDGNYSNLEQQNGGDYVGQGATRLSNGNYVVQSSQWTNAGVERAGAATWGSGTSGVAGVVSAANSLVGTHTNDYVSNYGITALSNGNYVVKSAQWSNGGFQSAGAVTWGNGTTGVSGAVSEINSLVGTHSNDYVGNSGVTALSNGNYVVNSPNWSGGTAAVTWGNGMTGATGTVSAANSLVGGNTGIYSSNVILDDINQRFYVAFPNDGGGTVRAASQNDGVVTAPTFDTEATLDGSGNLVLTEGNGTRNDALTLKVIGGNLVFTDFSHAFGQTGIGGASVSPDGHTLTIPVNSITGTGITINTGGGDDTLTLDLVDGTPGRTITFNGGAQATAAGDKLVVTGGNSTLTTYNYTNAHDGSVILTGGTTGAVTVYYTGLEPITNTGTTMDIVFNLPGGGNTAILQDVGGSGDGMSQLTSTLPSFELTNFANPTGSLTINTGSASDTITVNALPDFTASLTLGTSANPFSAIDFAGALALAANKNLDANASGTISFSNTNSDVATSGTGAIALTTVRDISLTSGSSVTTVNGALSLSANAAGTTTMLDGIDLDAATVQVTGTGTLTLVGKGGVGGGANPAGIVVRNSSLVSGGTSGLVSVTGTGGTGTSAGDGVQNLVGVSLESGSTITSAGANVQVTGIGGIASGTSAGGVLVIGNSTLTAGGTGTVTVSGTGGTGTDFNYGVDVVHGGTITSSNGAVTVTGTGGSASGGANNNNWGVFAQLGGKISAGGSGAVSVTGTGGTGSGGDHHGVVVRLVSGTAGQITSSGGSVTVTGTAGTGGSGSVGVSVQSGGAITTATNGGNVTLVADSMSLTSTVSANSAGFVTLQQKTNGTAINLGSAVDTTTNTLELSDTELDFVSAGTVQIGNASSGATTVSAAITHGNHLSLTTGAGVTFNQSVTMAVNKNLTVSALGTSNGTISLANANSDLATSGTGTILLTTARNIVLASGASVVTVNGALTFSANQQVAPTSGTFVGVDVNGGLVQATGSGNVSVSGKGGNSGASQTGVRVLGGGDIIGGASGTVTVIGTGGASTSSSIYGVVVDGTGSTIDSGGANVSVTGTGGTLGADNDKGVLLTNLGFITAGGAGTLTVSGTGGLGNSSNGVELLTGTKISSAGGAVTVTGIGGTGASASNSRGIVLSGTISAAGSGSVLVTGTGSTGTGGGNAGVLMERNGPGTIQEIKSATGNVTVTGTAGGGANSPAIFLNSVAAAAATISTASPGQILLVGDSMNFVTSASVSNPTGSVTLRQSTNGTQINLGAADSAGVLGLTSAELSLVNAGTIQIGDANSGALTVSAAISHTNTNAITLTAGSGQSINLNANFTTAGGPLTFSNNVVLGASAAVDTTNAGGVPAGAAINFGSTVNLGANTLTHNAGATATSIAGVISGVGGSFAKNGAGTLTLTNSTNTYTGVTNVNGGVLSLDGFHPPGNVGATNASPVFYINNASTLRIGGDRWDFSGKTFQFDSTGGGTLSVTSAGAGGFAFFGDNTFRTNGGAQNFITGGGDGLNINSGFTAIFDVASGSNPGGDLVVSVSIVNGGSISKTGAGTLVLSGANSYGGPTNIQNGALKLSGGANRLPVGTTVTLGNGAIGGVLDLNNQSQQLAGLLTSGSGTNRVVDSTNDATVPVLTLNVASGTNTFGGILGNTNQSGFALTKSGNGIVSLTGANTLTGATSITAGTLVVNGSITSNVTVTSPGTLGGNGTITGNVSGNGIVAAGNSPGTLTITGDFTPTGTVAFEVNQPYNTAGTDYDQIVVGGNVNLSGATLTFSGGTAAPSAQQLLKLISKTSVGATVASGITAEGSTVTLGSATFKLFYNGGDGNDVVLVDASAPTVVYASSSAWSSLTNGTVIADGDFGTAGNQPAIFGVNAFATIGTGISTVTTSGNVIVNAGTYAEAVSLNGTKTLTVTTGAAVTTNSFASIAGTTLAINGTGFVTGNAANTAIDGTITGAGTLTKQGAGTLTLSGGNNYTGSTTINGGAISITADSNLGTAPGSATPGHLTLNGGTLMTSGTFTLSSNRGLAVGASGGTINVSSATLTYAPVTTGSGQLTKSGAGTLQLGGTSSSFGGGVLLDTGVLRVTNNQALGTGTLTISNGTTLASGDATTRTLGNAVQVNGDFSLTQSSGGTGAVEFSNSINLGGATRQITIASSNGATFSGQVSSGGLTKAGAGSLTLTGTNIYSGTTTINAGTLQLGAGGTTGNAGSGQITLNGGKLALNRSDAPTFTNAISLAATGANYIDVASTTTATLSGQVSGFSPSELWKDGAGTLVLSNSGNVQQGSNVIFAGVLEISSFNALGNGNLYIGAGGSGTIRYTGGTTSTGKLTASTLQGTGVNNVIEVTNAATTLSLTASLGNTGAGRGFTKAGSGTLAITADVTHDGPVTISDGTLIIGNGATAGWITTSGTAAVVNNGALVFNRSDSPTLPNPVSGSGSLSQNGSGTLTLTGANLYGGGTNVNAGVLQIGSGGSAGALGAGTVTIGGGKLAFNRNDSPTFTNAISLTNNGNRFIEVTSGNTATLSGQISPSGAGTAAELWKSGAGTLVLSNTNNLHTSSNVIQAGTLEIANFGALGSASPSLYIGQGGSGTFRYTGASTSTGKIGSAALQSTGTNSTIEVSNSATVLTLSSALGNTGSGRGFTKAGAGTLVLAADSAHDGAVVISAGTLQVGSGGTAGTLTSSGSATITDGGALVFNRSDALVVSNAISGSGTLTKQGGSALTLSGPNSYAGHTTVSTGTLILGNATALGGTGNGTTVAPGATIDLGGQTVGAEGLDIQGTGVGGNGALINSSGTAASLSAAIVFAANTTVGGSGNITLSGGTSGAITLTKIGGNTLTLSGTADNVGLALAANVGTVILAKTSGGAVHAVNGAVTISGGTVQLGGSGGDQIANTAAVTVNSGTFAVTTVNETVAGVTLVTGSITGSSGVLTSTSAYDLRAGSVSAILGGSVGLTKTTGSTVTLSGANSYTGATTISAGALALSHSSSNNLATSPTLDVQTNATLSVGGLNAGTFALASGQTLKGNGTVSGKLTATSGSFLTPGASPGIITQTGDLTLSSGSTFVVEVNGATAGTQYDQVDVTGSVTLGGATLSTSGTITSSPGQEIVLIKNDGTEAVTGTFSGYAEGSNVTSTGSLSKSPTLAGRGGTTSLSLRRARSASSPMDSVLAHLSCGSAARMCSSSTTAP